MNASANSLNTSAISSTNINAKAQANIYGGTVNGAPVTAAVASASSTSVSTTSSTSNATTITCDAVTGKLSALAHPPGSSSVTNGPPVQTIESQSLNNNNNNGHRVNHHAEHLSKTNLYIRGLQSTTRDQDLYDMCSRFGHISSTKAILDKTTGGCRGYGFVEFLGPKSAELAVRELTKSGVQAQMAKISSSYSPHNQHHNHQHNNNNHQTNHNNNSHHQYNSHHQKSNNNGGYTTSHNSSGSQHNHNSSSNSSHKNNADPTNLYIANLPPNMSEPELEELLSNYGNIVSTRILRDESNNPRGVGFARMESRDKCEEIIEQLNGRPCKGSKEPLVVKFADGGNKKRHHYNNQHQHHSNNNNNHHNQQSHHKVNQDDNRWQDNANSKDISGTSSYEHHQGNMSHSNHPSDLAMMGPMSYPRMQPGFPPNVAAGGAYPAPLGPPSSTPQWIHPSGGQPYVIPQQMIQAGGLSPSNQAAAAAAAAMHYGHIPHLAAQMQGLQITHPAAHVGGYLTPQHQWPTLWGHPIPQQSPTAMGRLPTAPMHSAPPPPSIPAQHSSQMTPVQQSPQQQQHQHQPQQMTGQQHQTTVNDNKISVTVPQ